LDALEPLCPHHGFARCRDVVCDECKHRRRKGPPYGDELVVERSYNKPAKDMIHDPVHYARWPMQPIQFIATNNLPYWLANIIKYACRYDAKDGVQDLYKARSYLNMKIAELEGVPEFWKPREKS
jgi:hypothetical protein